MTSRRWMVLAVVAATIGFIFSAVSTYDSVAHLDRQVHGIHCSYLLGLGAPDASGSTGCYATLMSPYSSIMRQSIWGGIPVALPSMSVFGFILFWILWLHVTKRGFDRRATGFLLAAAGLPFLSSVVMGIISFVSLGVACKLCIGIYVASILVFVAALAIFLRAGKSNLNQEPLEARKPQVSWNAVFLAFGGGVFFVAVPCITYAAVAPDFSRYIGNCGGLKAREDPHQVMVPLDTAEGETPQGEVNVIEILDPLCGACKIVERRFSAMIEAKHVKRRLLLFPLDNKCNWMVDEAIHPGACTASEAILCAGNQAREVFDWIMNQQETLLEAAKNNPNSTKELLGKRFPRLRNCLGSVAVRARLNKALRWAVRNQLQVLTPQIFVEGIRLCDEDTDLGLEYAFSRLVARAKTAPASSIAPTGDEKPSQQHGPRESSPPLRSRPSPGKMRHQRDEVSTSEKARSSVDAAAEKKPPEQPPPPTSKGDSEDSPSPHPSGAESDVSSPSPGEPAAVPSGSPKASSTSPGTGESTAAPARAKDSSPATRPGQPAAPPSKIENTSDKPESEEEGRAP